MTFGIYVSTLAFAIVAMLDININGVRCGLHRIYSAVAGLVSAKKESNQSDTLMKNHLDLRSTDRLAYSFLFTLANWWADDISTDAEF